jgi:fermentation-respiration switch protein FrsA (DUF1100 family)
MLSFPSARRRRRSLWLSLFFIYFAYGAAMFSLQRSLIFPGQFMHPAPLPVSMVPRVEHWQLPVPGGTVEAILLAPSVAGGAFGQRMPAVIYAHGNGELIDRYPVALRRYLDWGMTVLMPEFRGYGQSAGRPSEEGIVEDYTRFHDRLAARSDIDPTRIVFHGRSLGGGVVSALAAKRKPAALIVQSTFARMATLAHRRFLPGFILLDPFDSISVVSGLNVPTFVAHGTRDDLIPFSDGEALADASHAEFHPMECAHNDCPPDWDALMGDVEAFLRKAAIIR